MLNCNISWHEKIKLLKNPVIHFQMLEKLNALDNVTERSRYLVQTGYSNENFLVTFSNIYKCEILFSLFLELFLETRFLEEKFFSKMSPL